MNIQKLIEYYRNSTETRYLNQDELNFMCNIYQHMMVIHQSGSDYIIIDSDDGDVLEFLKLLGYNASFIVDMHSDILGIRIVR